MGGLFSMKGRLNRAEYFGAVVEFFVVPYIIIFVISRTAFGSAEIGGDFLGLIISVGSSILMAFQIVKRLHDLNRPGWHYWLLLLPIYNIYLGLLLLFRKGTAGSNKYDVALIN